MPAKSELKNFLGNKIYRAISIRLTRILLHTSITANQATVFSILCGILCGVFLSLGRVWSFIFGSIFLIFFAILDRVDGEIARYRKVFTFRGKYLEISAHYIVDLSINIGLVLGIYNIYPNNEILIIGSLMILLDVLIKIFKSIYFEAIFLCPSPKVGKNLKTPTSSGIIREIGVLTSHLFFPYWIIFGILLDTIIPLTFSYLVFYIVFLIIFKSLKLFKIIEFYLKIGGDNI